MPIDLSRTNAFLRRHLGPSEEETAEMLNALQFPSLDAFIATVVPAHLRSTRPLELGAIRTEYEVTTRLRAIAAKNKIYRSLIGMGYSDTITPPVIQRNILENPGWYTQYTPYQAEIAQGRLEALLNFQTMVIDLTGLPVANASLLDEATAAAEAMTTFYRARHEPAGGRFFVSQDCHPQNIAVVKTRALPLGIEIIVGDHEKFEFTPEVFGALLQYPASDGAVYDYHDFCRRAHAAGALVAVAADLMSLVLLTPPGEFGADAAVGSTQRFGVPLGYGGPHAAFFAVREEFKRLMPGRIIGVSIDAHGQPALRMALQTREQHIRREKATSNICTAQVLPAVMAAMYAVYHGPQGLRRIATRIHNLTKVLALSLTRLGYRLYHEDFFDTLRVEIGQSALPKILAAADARHFNFRKYDNGSLGIALDQISSAEEVAELLNIFALERVPKFTVAEVAAAAPSGYAGKMPRRSAFLQHPVFNRYHSETEMLRYLRRLESRDLSLTTSMIPLGSCTMKLNATSEMMPLSWPEFSKLHPFAPVEQAAGYQELFHQLETWLAEITGFAAISLQPNSGAQGEYTGLQVIRAYHRARGEQHRTVCLIPQSAHGTNPASAVMAGLEVVVVRCDEQGNIDVADLKARAQQHRDRLAALMVTYPSTHGVFEEAITDICEVIHRNGGQVYMDGANLNAQVGLCRPAELGADVCHLNLHKTFAIPHGGGGPGMGPIGVAAHLAPFLPTHPVIATGGEQGIGPVAAAPWGSASILVISWAYIAMMGGAGLTTATKMAILNANYMAHRLQKHFPILYKGINGRVAHEFILDLRGFKSSAGIEVEDIAKRLMDYGFHAPTVSFPVAGTLMIEPTESESKAELDRFCDALIAIKGEIEEIEQGRAARGNNVLVNAPHTATAVVADNWQMPYSRMKAAFPAPWLRQYKFWPAVGRINNAYGDRNLVCACPPVASYHRENHGT
ncbi:MAG: aminomethyl-transferring glycine dehydrogenase [candidate division KSB1 bacterium]|nr:aminomethyl-transferring glycine dehydrogenase [candidate division KSB1 bacterium]MDZ7275761.1 aminomethyl-transferring glycine dehydrogenase [candidate division KSB1 bacterium]MDZ7284548.1 aminomethyl-transferring glycine dehydrogenase [candidate division KSB1 bacterium]MDZ7298033.1 aminomethyl-transferring glycine dehydrogenase [candidate division KSB1 bacterium]MDZ7309300.1 aminomethyl-transferring glycine dehydrogenase [candidate division KSB1 bacterium]